MWVIAIAFVVLMLGAADEAAPSAMCNRASGYQRACVTRRLEPRVRNDKLWVIIGSGVNVPEDKVDSQPK